MVAIGVIVAVVLAFAIAYFLTRVANENREVTSARSGVEMTGSGGDASGPVSEEMARKAEELLKKIRDDYEERYETAVKEYQKETDELKKEYHEVERKCEKAQDLRIQTEAVVQSMGEGMVVVNDKGEVVLMNPAAEKLLGVEEKNKVGKSITEGTASEAVVSMCRGSKDTGEKIVEFSCGSEDAKRTLRSSNAVIQNEEGETVGMVSILTDVTQQKKLVEEEKRRAAAEAKVKMESQRADELKQAYEELKSAQDKLIQADRLAAIGQLSAGVAHEINNPIGYVETNLEALSGYLKSFTLVREASHRLMDSIRNEKSIEKASQRVQDISELEEKLRMDFILGDLGNLLTETQSGLGRIKKIIMDLKTFARRDEKEALSLTDIHKVLESALNIVWNELKYRAEVKKDFGRASPVMCNQRQLAQVFVNILVNAAQAMKERGTIALRTYDTGSSVCVEIEDTGSGMPEDVKKHIFDPFFTTKEVGQGTGLGLSISFDIIEKHGGDIVVDSEVGKGTKFVVSLPKK